MPEVGRVRLRLPSAIRRGDVIRVRSLVIHPMERVERDREGRVVDRKYRYIDRVVVTYLGETVLTIDMTQSVSENPSLSFALKVTAAGRLTVTFLDTHGGRYEGAAEIRFA
jgi:sulfur-oxidizing protein SoxZ